MRKSEEVTTEKYEVIYTVGQHSTGERLDHYLQNALRSRSRHSIQKAIERGAVVIKRKNTKSFPLGKLKSATPIQAQDEITITTIRSPEPEVNFDYQILYEDDVLYVLNKPPNLPVHPSGRFYFNTLLTHLRTRGFTLPLKESDDFYLPHRIDRETSGVLVLTKTKETCAHLVEQFVDRRPKKTYVALTYGICPTSFSADESLIRSNEINKKERVGLRMAVCPKNHPGSQHALTEFRRLNVLKFNGQDFSLVECFPKTGRQHQIRVHLANKGFPIVGDKLYSLPDDDIVSYFDGGELTQKALDKLILSRHALHAAHLEFTHPVSKKCLHFNAPLTKDLKIFLSKSTILEEGPSSLLQL